MVKRSRAPEGTDDDDGGRFGAAEKESGVHEKLQTATHRNLEENIPIILLLESERRAGRGDQKLVHEASPNSFGHFLSKHGVCQCAPSFPLGPFG